MQEQRIIYSLAPMEGITTAAMRRAHCKIFPGTDRYYSPFIATGAGFLLKNKDRRSILPENNRGLTLIPQLLSNNAEMFLKSTEQLAEIGYREINLNLGCPSGTVSAKRRGAGFLADPAEMDRFFSAVFEGIPAVSERIGEEIRISVKTRIGIEDPEEAFRILEVYNRYPICELIVHPRVLKEYYKGSVHQDIFISMYKDSKNPIAYNGDIRFAEDEQEIRKKCPGLGHVMIGRGLIRNPALIRMLRGGMPPEKEEILRYLDVLLANTAEEIREERNQLGKMKDIWYHLGDLFSEDDRYLKKVRKATSVSVYRSAVEELVNRCEILY
ncbi:MAG: tRNA-dihydrouridine synthase family protein [Lachnospiraceae bacterium]|nr:tRNA-dihydrouridine synthase family protein [Lachnospiraceae bacterium]